MSIDRFFTEYGLYQRPLSMKVLFWLLDNPEESLSWASFQTTRQKLRTATRYLLKKGLITTKCRESDAKVTHYSPVTERLQPILPTTSQPQANHELTTSRPHVYKTGTQAGSYAHYLDQKQKNKTTKKEKTLHSLFRHSSDSTKLSSTTTSGPYVNARSGKHIAGRHTSPYGPTTALS